MVEFFFSSLKKERIKKQISRTERWRWPMSPTISTRSTIGRAVMVIWAA